MSKIVAVPEDLYNKAAEVAAKDCVSVDEFVSAAVANRLAGRFRIIRSILRSILRPILHLLGRFTVPWAASVPQTNSAPR